MILDIEDQVCSLELAKKLKELNVRQDSLFYYNVWILSGKIRNYEIERSRQGSYENSEPFRCECYSAFTVAEIGEMLPVEFAFSKRTDKWFYCGNGLDIEDAGFDDEKEADARAKMLIYLIEKGFIERK